MTKYVITQTRQFKKQLRLMIRQGKRMDKLSNIVDILSSGEKLPEPNRDHSLITTPRFKGCRECHIEPDWLLIYQKVKKELILILVETGSHSDLFQK